MPQAISNNPLKIINNHKDPIWRVSVTVPSGSRSRVSRLTVERWAGDGPRGPVEPVLTAGCANSDLDGHRIRNRMCAIASGKSVFAHFFISFVNLKFWIFFLQKNLFLLHFSNYIFPSNFLVAPIVLDIPFDRPLSPAINVLRSGHRRRMDRLDSMVELLKPCVNGANDRDRGLVLDILQKKYFFYFEFIWIIFAIVWTQILRKPSSPKRWKPCVGTDLSSRLVAILISAPVWVLFVKHLKKTFFHQNHYFLFIFRTSHPF